MAIGNLILNCDYAEVVKNYVLYIHRDLYFAALSLAKGPSKRKVVVIVYRSVSATLLLVFNQLLGNDLVLVGYLIQLGHELFRKQVALHLWTRVETG